MNWLPPRGEKKVIITCVQDSVGPLMDIQPARKCLDTDAGTFYNRLLFINTAGLEPDADMTRKSLCGWWKNLDHTFMCGTIPQNHKQEHNNIGWEELPRPGIVRERAIFVRKGLWKRTRQKVEMSELGVEGC